MATTCAGSFPTIAGCDFPLWSGCPESWLRSLGTTRVLIIDDQYVDRQSLLDAVDATPGERMLAEWLNVELDFLRPPADYRGGTVPSGTFDDAWFASALARSVADSRPVALVLLDLLWGRETRIENASGPRFLSRLREQLPDVPVLVFSNVVESLEVRRRV